MLEKIGLPAKPSLRGNNLVVDASHCQGCCSQFTFINRKHHCRRCGGLFCNSCTQQRMILRGQGDSPVRICEPCKKLEDAARFEMRHGYKTRAAKGHSKHTLKNEDNVLNKILGGDGKESSFGRLSSNEVGSSMQRATSSASSSNIEDPVPHDGLGDTLQNDIGSVSLEELRQRAVEEKKKYKILKGEGKSAEALRAFKRGKELEREVAALEISMRKNRKRVLTSGNKPDTQNKDSSKESGRKINLFPKSGEQRDDFASELRELGWSDMDIKHEDKKSANMSLEGELSSLLGDVTKKTGKDAGAHGIDKSPVIALKRKALVLKREGKLEEAKEELKKAKILEKQLEEQELLTGAEDSDDELSAIIQDIDNDEQDDFPIQYEQEPVFDHLVTTADDLGGDSNFEVTDEDMEDPEIAAALKSLGWTGDSDHTDSNVPQSASLDREALSMEILSLKREALNQKRAGNVAEAMAHLKKAKLLERDLGGSNSQAENLVVQNPKNVHAGSISQDSETLSKTAKANEGNTDFTKDMDHKVARKSRLMIQKELLGLKRNALALRREGKIDEAEEELKKCQVLEHQLEEMDNASKVKTTGNRESDLAYKDPFTIDLPVGEGEDNVTDQDMDDPKYLSILMNLGWNDKDNELTSLPSRQKDKSSVHIMESPLIEATSDIPARVSSRSKAEIQRELLGLKRKALSLRRQGKTDEAEEVLKTAKVLEAEMENMETPKKFQVESNWPRDKAIESLINHEKQGNMAPQVGVNMGSAQMEVFSNDKAVESSQLIEGDHPLLGKLGSSGETGSAGKNGAAESTAFIPPPGQSVNLMDLHSWTGSQIPAGKLEDKGNLSSDISSRRTTVQMDSLSKSHEDLGSKNDIQTDKREVVHAYEYTDVPEVNPAQGSASQNKQTLLWQDVLAHKRNAVALKREGKLAEAREELRQAKLLEKSLGEVSIQPKSITSDVSATASKIPSDGQKKHGESNLAPKPLSARDRFKLQQESLSHKRKALKLRREGLMNEAEAEFEKAKNLEAQLEELAAQDSKTSANEAEPINDIMVEDFLDPQLLSALKAIGLDDANMATERPERPEPVKQGAAKGDNLSQERIQLEERIKAEKVKAVDLKRSGKQAEALDALRRAKLFEKKLNSLASN